MDATRFEEYMLLDAIRKWHNAETVAALLRKGVNPDIRDAGFTALEFAAVLPGTDVLELMLHHGATSDLRNDHGSTALHAACTVAAAGLLLAAGAAIDAVDEEGMTPLHYAVLRGLCVVIAFLIERNANPLAANARGDTPEDLARGDAELCAPFLAWRAEQEVERLSAGVCGLRPLHSGL
jgi:ankyrin repeat protein